MRKILSILLIFSAVVVRAQNHISVDEYRRAVVDYSHTLRIARSATLAAEEQAALSHTGLLPRLDAAGRFEVALRQHAGVKPFSLSVQPLVVQTIYAGGARRATYESDRVGADAALSDEFLRSMRWSMRPTMPIGIWLRRAIVCELPSSMSILFAL